MDTYLAPVFEPLFEEKGLKLLQWNELGFVHVFGKRPLIAPEDFAGKVMRASPSHYSVSFWQGMGVPAVILSLSDLSGALQSGMVDGGTLAIPTYVGFGMARFAPHLTLSGHVYQSGALVMSLKRWNGYKPDTQRLILQSLRPLQSLRDDVRTMTAAILQQFEANGGQVHRLTVKQRSVWQDRVRQLRGDFVASIGGRAAEIWPLIQSARNKCTSDLALVDGELR